MESIVVDKTSIVGDPQIEFVNVGYKHLELAKVILKSCTKNCGA